MIRQVRCPRALSDIEPGWLGEVLQENYPGVEVVSTEVVELTQGTSTRLRLKAEYAQNGVSTPPRALFVKSAFENDFRDMMTSAGIYEAEERAFTEILPHVSARTPELHASALDETDGQFLLVMEDLVDSGVAWLPVGEPVSVDTAAQVLADMAGWHGRFWNDPWLDAQAWIPTPHESGQHDTTRAFAQYGADVLRDRWAESLPSDVGDLLAAFETLLEAVSHSPRTLLHGDPHLGNIGILDGKPIFFDWQVVRKGHAALDLSYFLTMSLTIEDRRTHEEALLRGYFDRLTANGSGHESFDALWASYRIQVLYGLMVWAATPEQMQPANVSVPYVTRALAALNDLDTLAAIRELS